MNEIREWALDEKILKQEEDTLVNLQQIIKLYLPWLVVKFFHATIFCIVFIY